MEIYERKAKFSELKKYCHLAKPESFIEVCEWNNGEGFDVTIDNRHLQLTWGELEAINVLSKYVE